jgi:hypothetical protein
MDTKTELIAEIDKLIDLLRTRSTSVLTLVFLAPKFAEIVSEFSSKCIDLQKKVYATEDGSPNLLELKKEFLDLEIWVKRRVAKNNLMPTVLVLYVGIFLVITVLRFVDISGFITKTLGVAAPERLITLGIAGAFVYLATSLLTKVTPRETKDKQLSNVIDFTIRLALAIVVPIILVILFFRPDGTIGDVAITPELLSFSCGYSAKLVVDVFNKFVEKASKMIEAI